MVAPTDEEDSYCANNGSQASFARARRNIRATMTPSPGTSIYAIRVKGFTRPSNNLRLIFKFWVTRIGVDTFLRFNAASAHTTSIRASASGALFNRMLFVGYSTRVSNYPKVSSLLQAKATMLRRRGQVFFTKIRINQFRRVTIRLRTFLYNRLRGLANTRLRNIRFTIRFPIILRRFRHFTFIITGQNGVKDASAKVRVRMMLRIFTRSNTIYTNFPKRFCNVSLTIHTVSINSRKLIDHVNYVMRDTFNHVMTMRYISGGFTFNCFLRRDSIRIMRMRTIMSIAFTNRSGSITMRDRIARSVFISMLIRVIAGGLLTFNKTQVNRVRFRAILVTIRNRSDWFNQIFNRTSAKGVTLNVRQRFSNTSSPYLSIRDLCTRNKICHTHRKVFMFVTSQVFNVLLFNKVTTLMP